MWMCRTMMRSSVRRCPVGWFPWDLYWGVHQSNFRGGHFCKIQGSFIIPMSSCLQALEWPWVFRRKPWMRSNFAHCTAVHPSRSVGESAGPPVPPPGQEQCPSERIGVGTHFVRTVVCHSQVEPPLKLSSYIKWLARCYWRRRGRGPGFTPGWKHQVVSSRRGTGMPVSWKKK